MREIFKYGSVGRALRKRCLYPEDGPGIRSSIDPTAHALR